MRAALSWLMVLVFIGCANRASGQTPDAGARSGSSGPEIGISFESADSGPRRIGTMVAGKMSISYKNAPSGTSVYLMVHPLKGDALLTPEGATIHSTGLEMDFVTNLEANSDGGLFRIDRANYPEELLIPPSALGTLASKLWDAESAKAIAAAFGPQGLRMVLGFLTSLGRGGDGREQAFFSFMLPKLEHSYDGVLITPILISYEKDGRQRIVFRSGQMHSLKISVNSD
jgi:hypothetical protein